MMFRIFKPIVFLFFLASCGSDSVKPFPDLTPGSYKGSVSISSSTHPLYVEVGQFGGVIATSLGYEGELTSKIPYQNVNVAELLFEGTPYKLSGSSSSQKGYVLDSTLKQVGSWSLDGLVDITPFDNKSPAMQIGFERVIKKIHLKQLSTEIQDLTKMKSRLEEAIEDPTKIREKVLNKRVGASSELKALDVKIAARKTVVDELEGKLRAAQSFSQTGRLVSLARQSLEIEQEWMNKTIGVADRYLPKHVRNKIQQSKEILELQNEIEGLETQIMSELSRQFPKDVPIQPGQVKPKGNIGVLP